MHNISVLAIGSENFNITLTELKDHLNFKLAITHNQYNDINFDKYDVLILHEDIIKVNFFNKIIKDSKIIKILATNSAKKKLDCFNDLIRLPIKINDLNTIVSNSVTKKNFNINSSIVVKNYNLNKNEKKIIKGNDYILLTEKEIELLELFLKYPKPISKDKILSEVWKYSTSADTHTVETHIYRLRKKIKSKFLDENFILNKKDGYCL